MAGLSSSSVRAATIGMMVSLHQHRIGVCGKFQDDEASVCARMEVPGYPCVIIEAKTTGAHSDLARAYMDAGHANEGLATRQPRDVVLSARVVRDWKTQAWQQWLYATFLVVTGGAKWINKVVQDEQVARRTASAEGVRKALDGLGLILEARCSGQLPELVEAREAGELLDAPDPERMARASIQVKVTESRRELRAALGSGNAFSSALDAMTKAATEFQGCHSMESDNPKQRWLDMGGKFSPENMFEYSDRARIDLPVEERYYVKWADVVEPSDCPAMTSTRDPRKVNFGASLLACEQAKRGGAQEVRKWEKDGQVSAVAVHSFSQYGAMNGMKVPVYDPAHPERHLYMMDGKLCDFYPMVTLNAEGEAAVFAMVDGQIDYVERAVTSANGDDVSERREGVLEALSTDPGISRWFFGRVASTIRLDRTGRTLHDMMRPEDFKTLQDAYVVRERPLVRQPEAQVMEIV